MTGLSRAPFIDTDSGESGGTFNWPELSPYHALVYFGSLDDPADVTGREYVFSVYEKLTGTVAFAIPGTIETDADDHTYARFVVEPSAEEWAAIKVLRKPAWEIGEKTTGEKVPGLGGPIVLAKAAEIADATGPGAPGSQQLVWSPAEQVLVATFQGSPGLPGTSASQQLADADIIADADPATMAAYLRQPAEQAATTANAAATAAQTATTSANTATTAANSATSAANSAATNANTQAAAAQSVVNAGASILAAATEVDADRVAAEAAAVTAQGLVGALKVQAPYGYAGGIADSQGRYIALFPLDGSVRFGVTRATRFTASQVTTSRVITGATTIEPTVPNGYILSLATDPQGRMTAGVRKDGALGATKLVGVRSINGKAWSEIAAGGTGTTTVKPVLDAEVNGFIFYGQSRSAGSDGKPAISTTQPYDSLMFNGGARPYDLAAGTTASRRASLVPLVEQNSPAGDPPGESSASGAADWIKQRIVADYGIALANQSYQMLMSVEGTGGTDIAGLDVGTNQFNAVKADIDYGFALAGAAGKTYVCRGFSMSQGESDYQANTPIDTYQTTFVNIRSTADAYAKSVTGQTQDVVCIMDQVFGHATYGHANDPYIALRQLKIANEQPGFVMAFPAYFIPRASGVHATAAGYRWMGAYFGRAYQRVVIEKGVWSPLQPVSTLRQGNTVLVRYAPESGKLAFDQVTVGAVSNRGFTLVDSGGTAITISSVSIINDSVIKIVAAAPVPAGAKVRYGFPGSGNLRDTTGDKLTTTISGTVYPMHNWAVISENTLA